jgi:hypothetical protein
MTRSIRTKRLCLLAIVSATLAVPAMADELAPMALNSFTFVPARITQAIVVDQGGTALGIVAKVDSDASGTPRQVEVLKPGGDTMILAARAASYDPVANRVVADSAMVGAIEKPIAPRS